MTFRIGPRTDVETYRMRKSPTYKGDYVETHTRMINGKPFDFSRVFWGDGTVSVCARIGGQVTEVKYWEGAPDPLVCGHVPSYGCDCDTVAAESASI